MQPERRRDCLLAGLIGLIVAALVGIGSLVLVETAARESLPTLTQATRAGANTVGEAVAAQVGRALDYGIPLDGLYGLDDYFAGIVAGSPHVAALGLYDMSGAIVFQTREGVRGPVFPVTADGAERALLVLAPAPPLVGPAMDRLWIALGANAGLTGLIAGVVSFLFLSRHHAVSRRRLAGLMQAAMADRFPPLPPMRGGGTVAAACQAFDHCLDVLRAAARQLADAVATLRAIDFDGSLNARLEPLLRPASGVLALSDHERPGAPAWTERNDGRLWLAAAAPGVYAMSLPFVANFAVDRTWHLAGPAWWPVLPGLAEAVAAGLAFLILRRTGALLRPFLAAGGLAAAGLATALACWTGDYTPFLELRLAAGAGLGATIAALAGQDDRAGAETGPSTAVLLVSVLVAGPLLGGLLGEAIGRRSSFLVVGLLLLALAPLAFLLRHDRSGGAAAPRPGADSGPALAAAGIAAGAVLVVWLPAGPGYEGYLTDGLLTAAAGLAACLLPVRPLALAGLVAAGGMILAAWPEAGPALQAGGLIVLGSGLGGLARAGKRPPDGAVPILGVGLAAGAATIGLAGLAGLPAAAAPLSLSLPLPQTLPAAALVLVLALAGTLAWARARTAPSA